MVAHLARKSSLTSLTGHISPLHLRFLLSTLLVTFLTTIPLYSFISWPYCALWIPGLNSSGRSTHGQSVALLTQSYCSLCQPLRLPAHRPTLCSTTPFLQSTHPLCSPAHYLPTAPSVLTALNPIALSAHRPLSCPPPLCSTPPLCPPWGDRIWHWSHDSFSFHLLKPTKQPTLFLYYFVR